MFVASTGTGATKDQTETLKEYPQMAWFLNSWYSTASAATRPAWSKVLHRGILDLCYSV